MYAYHTEFYTVEPSKFAVLETRGFNLNGWLFKLYGGKHKNIKLPKMIIIRVFFPSNICFVCLKERSQGDMLSKTVVRIYHE